jgi:hypothetical protein
MLGFLGRQGKEVHRSYNVARHGWKKLFMLCSIDVLIMVFFSHVEQQFDGLQGFLADQGVKNNVYRVAFGGLSRNNEKEQL